MKRIALPLALLTLLLLTGCVGKKVLVHQPKNLDPKLIVVDDHGIIYSPRYRIPDSTRHLLKEQ